MAAKRVLYAVVLLIAAECIAADPGVGSVPTTFRSYSVEDGVKVVAAAKLLVKEYRRDGTANIFGGHTTTGKYSDCSHFVHTAYEMAGFEVPYSSTVDFSEGHTPAWFSQVPYAAARPGDLMIQGGHMAIFTGFENGAPMGAQLGSKSGPSIRAFGPTGYFANPHDLRFYRLKAA